MIYCHTRGFAGPRDYRVMIKLVLVCPVFIIQTALSMPEGIHFGPYSLGDTGNGFLSAIGICQALYERKTTGKGQFVDTSIINATLLNVCCRKTRWEFG